MRYNLRPEFRKYGWIRFPVQPVTLKAAAYHKNLAQEYALKAGCAVLFVDYRLAPKNRFPVPVKDCFKVYSWALENLCCKKVVS